MNVKLGIYIIKRVHLVNVIRVSCVSDYYYFFSPSRLDKVVVVVVFFNSFTVQFHNTAKYVHNDQLHLSNWIGQK